MADTDPYISEMTACIRHPFFEAGQESTFHVAITQWKADPLGVMRPQVAITTPEAAERAGFSIDKILGETVAAAMRDSRRAQDAAADADRERDAAIEAREAALKQAAEAISTAEAHSRTAAEAIRARQVAEANEAALMMEIEKMKDEQPGWWSRLRSLLPGG